MVLTEADIKRLKTEAKRDLEALERVEAMLKRQSPAPPFGHFSVHVNESSRTRLRDLISEILRQSKDPLSPKEIVQLATEQGYTFTSPRNGLGSVTSVLSRKKGKGVHKLADGRWAADK